MPSPEVYQRILIDLREGRLTLFEIAAKHLGDGKRKGEISVIAKKEKIPVRRPGRSKQKSSLPKFDGKKSISDAPLKIETFDSKKRLDLIDEALSQLKAILPRTNYSKGMNEWTSAAERLMNLRREEEPVDPNEIESDDYLEAVRGTAKDDWKEEASALQVEASEQEATPGNELVDA